MIPREQIACGSRVLRFGGKWHGHCLVPTSHTLTFFGSAILAIHLGTPLVFSFSFSVYSKAAGYDFVSRATSRALSFVGNT